MKKIYLIGFALAAGTASAQSPGGVSGVSFWLKSDQVPGSPTAYADFSGNSHQVVSPSAGPSLSLMNYNEAFMFDGLQNYLKVPYIMETLNKASLFTAYQSYGRTAECALVTSEKSGEKELSYSTSNIFRYNNSQINYIDPAKADSLASFAMFSEFGIPTGHISQAVGSSGASSSLYIGKDVSGKGWQAFRGKIPEIILYRKVLTQNERDRVNSYLAVKYAVTMPMTEYLSSKSARVWKKEDYSEYPENVAAIARDSYSGLYQKQASSTSDGGRLTIAAGRLARDNRKNGTEFPNHTYLVWGNDKNTLELGKEEFGSQTLNRRWKVRLTTESGGTVPTEVRFSTKGLVGDIPPDKTLWLLVDRTGKGSFGGPGVDVFQPESTGGGTAVYRDVVFDKDMNGSDVFTFALGPRLLAIPKLVQPTCQNPAASMELELKGGSAPYTVALKGARTGTSLSATGSSHIVFANLPPDDYQAVARDAAGALSSFGFNVSSFNDISLDLGPLNREIRRGEYVELDASKNMPSTTTYSWSSNNGFSSSSPKVKIYTGGKYTATVSTPDGCSKSVTVDITEIEGQGIAIYPNPTKAGEDFTIGINMQLPGDVDVQIFDMAGRLVKARKERGSSRYQLKESIPTEGAYIVLVGTPTERKTFRIIIN